MEVIVKDDPFVDAQGFVIAAPGQARVIQIGKMLIVPPRTSAAASVTIRNPIFFILLSIRNGESKGYLVPGTKKGRPGGRPFCEFVSRRIWILAAV